MLFWYRYVKITSTIEEWVIFMASFCPKCGYKLSMIDIKPECPVCGINLVYYGMEESLKEEADRAEFEHAASQPAMDRLKAATIGHPVAIVRLVFSLLPLVATLAPMGKVVVNLPYFQETTTINIIAIVNKVFMALDFDYLLSIVNSEMVGKAYIFYFVALLGFVLMALTTIVNIVNLFFSCGKKGIKRNITTAAVGIVFTVIASVGLAMWLSGVTAAVPDVFNGTFNALGPVCVVLAFVLQIVINVIYKKMNIQVKYKDMSKFLLSYDERKALEEKEEAEKAEAEA